MEFSSLTFSSTGSTLEESLYTLAELDEADCFPFPSSDIVHIERTVTSRKKLTRRLIKNFFIRYCKLLWWCDEATGMAC